MFQVVDYGIKHKDLRKDGSWSIVTLDMLEQHNTSYWRLPYKKLRKSIFFKNSVEIGDKIRTTGLAHT